MIRHHDGYDFTLDNRSIFCCHLEDEAGEFIVLEVAQLEGVPEFLRRGIVDVEWFAVENIAVYIEWMREI